MILKRRNAGGKLRRQKAVGLGHRLAIYLIEDVSFVAYLLSFATAVFLFGLIYVLLTPGGNGIGHNFAPIDGVTLADGIYFSVVTFSSLGYGDMHPMGWSRYIAVIEVLFGLSLIGIMIAKVTSRRLSHHVVRLFASDAQKRLDELGARFNACRDKLVDLMTQLGQIYQVTPGDRDDVPDRPDVKARLRDVLGSVNSRSAALYEYLEYELQQGNYLDLAPEAAVQRVGDSVDKVFMILAQLIVSLPPAARAEILDRANRQSISEAIRTQVNVCALVQTYARADSTSAVFQRIHETCDNLPESFFAVPEEGQPDQLLGDLEELQDDEQSWGALGEERIGDA